MTEAVDSLHNSKIKVFEQKVINNSFLDLNFYDKMADYLLECCHAEAKPNTLSFFSFLPLFVLSLTVTGPSHLSFLGTIICILIHQMFDIANKKQAYRLSSFTLATFYIDHVFDALSCTCLVLVISRLLELSPGSSLTAIFFFGMWPFYLEHLSMYNNEYMEFLKISPTTEGLVLIKLLFLVGVFYPSFFQVQITEDIAIYQIFIGLAAFWLIPTTTRSISHVLKGKRITDAKAGTEEHYPIKNIFVLFMMGYLVLEISSIEPLMIEDTVMFYLAFSVLSLLFAHIIGRLVLAYGYNESFKQITLPFLIIMGILVIFYTFIVFGLRGNQSQVLITKILLGVILAVLFLFFARESWKNILHINQVVAG